MSKETEHLGLFQYDPDTDGSQTFNIKTALNDNWDKVDTADAAKAKKDLSNVGDSVLAAKLQQAAEGGSLTPDSIGAVGTGMIGQPGGVAGLDEGGKVSAAQLPEMDYEQSGAAANAVAGHNSAANAHAGLFADTSKNSYGMLSQTDVLLWALQQSRSGAFLLMPDCTNTPVAERYYQGWLEKSIPTDATLRLIDPWTGKMYTNITVSGAWRGWTEMYGGENYPSSCVVGQYIGNGATSGGVYGEEQAIVLGFAPKAVIVYGREGSLFFPAYAAIVTTSIPDTQTANNNSSYRSLALASDGFRVYNLPASNSYGYLNMSGQVYAYIAWR